MLPILLLSKFTWIVSCNMHDIQDSKNDCCPNISIPEQDRLHSYSSIWTMMTTVRGQLGSIYRGQGLACLMSSPSFFVILLSMIFGIKIFTVETSCYSAPNEAAFDFSSQACHWKLESWNHCPLNFYTSRRALLPSDMEQTSWDCDMWMRPWHEDYIKFATQWTAQPHMFWYDYLFAFIADANVSNGLCKLFTADFAQVTQVQNLAQHTSLRQIQDSSWPPKALGRFVWILSQWWAYCVDVFGHIEAQISDNHAVCPGSV